MDTKDNKVLISARMYLPPKRTACQVLADFCSRTSPYDSRRTLEDMGIAIIEGPTEIRNEHFDGTFYKVTLPTGWTEEPECGVDDSERSTTIRDSYGNGKLTQMQIEPGRDAEMWLHR